jgi:hypothetical protein
MSLEDCPGASKGSVTSQRFGMTIRL